MATTPVSGLRYPATSDLPNGPQQIQNLATDLDHLVIPKYATTAARDTANPAPNDSDVCYCTTPGAWYFRTGGVWQQVAIPPKTTALSAASGWSTPAGHGQQVFLDASGLVCCAGWVQNNNQFTPSGVELMTTLPAGFRPAQTHNYAVALQPTGAFASNWYSATIQVQTNGNVVSLLASAQIQPGTYWDLSAIRFHPTSSA